MTTPRICSVTGCGNNAYGRGFCNRHYQRWRRHGDPLLGRVDNGEGLAFFLSQLRVETPACIDWPYGSSAGGYGEIQYNGRTHTVHALACAMKHGPKPAADREVAHSCGRRICMNHRHLRWATRKENVADAALHGTALRGTKAKNAKLTEADVREIRRAKGRVSQDVLATQFSVHRAHIKDIQMRRRWAWLD